MREQDEYATRRFAVDQPFTGETQKLSPIKRRTLFQARAKQLLENVVRVRVEDRDSALQGHWDRLNNLWREHHAAMDRKDFYTAGELYAQTLHERTGDSIKGNREITIFNRFTVKLPKKVYHS